MSMNNLPARVMACAALALVSTAAYSQTPATEASPATESQGAAAWPPPQTFRTGVLHPDYKPELPTLFLIGDSTVKNSWDKGSDGLWGWGKPLESYFDRSRINVENQALGGTSSRSYITQGHWDRVLALVKPGDYVMMQFGHNDGGGAANARGSLRGNGADTQEVSVGGNPETVHTYGWYIRKYIDDTKAKGATPIVCSLIPRNTWSDGRVARATASYGGWAQEAAKQGEAQFIDLNGIIADHYDRLGQEAVKPFFPKIRDPHTGWRGAKLNAECVVEGIKRLPECPLVKYLSDAPNPIKPDTDPTDG